MQTLQNLISTFLLDVKQYLQEDQLLCAWTPSQHMYAR